MGAKPSVYTKEWWAIVLNTPIDALAPCIAASLVLNRAHIQNFVDNVPLEYKGPCGQWLPCSSVTMFTSDSTRYRVAPPKPIEVDVLVYWSGETTHHNFTRPAGIRTDALRVDPAHPKAKTMASMEANIPDFKLLSITRVVVDRETHNLMEYTTKLDNLGRVPF